MSTHPDPAPRHGRLWVLFGTTIFAAFFILGFFGRDVYRQAPPIPLRVLSDDGRVLLTRDDILTGQQVWQTTGGQQLGSIWGHGAYQAPDWSADWLHREATALLDVWAEAPASTTGSAIMPKHSSRVFADAAPLGYPAEILFQGPIADALTHVGQLSMMRGAAGAPVRPESYARASIAAGVVGLEQPPPGREFDGDASRR